MTVLSLFQAPKRHCWSFLIRGFDKPAYVQGNLVIVPYLIVKWYLVGKLENHQAYRLLEKKTT